MAEADRLSSLNLASGEVDVEMLDMYVSRLPFSMRSRSCPCRTFGAPLESEWRSTACAHLPQHRHRRRSHLQP